MAKNKLRKISVWDQTFLWKREHLHLTDFKHSDCVEKVVIYLEGYKQSPIQLFFREEDNSIIKNDQENEKWCVGNPDEGVIWLYERKSPLPTNEPDSSEDRQTVSINLNRPAVIAKLIEYFFQKEWKPRETSNPLIIKDALKLLELIKLPQGIK